MDDRPVTNGLPGPHDDLRLNLAEAYDACAEGLFRYAGILLADPAAAEEAVQQVFVKLAGSGRPRDIRAVAAYLRRAVRNECYRLLQRRSRDRQAGRQRALLVAVPNSTRPEVDEALRAALERAIKSLAPEQREVVHMKVYERMTFRQIAEATAVPLNTAASRYRYALLRLRELLGPYAEEQ